MNIYEGCKEILKIQKFRRLVSYTGFYCFVAVLSYAYTSNTTRAGYSRADQFYASYPAGTELLTDTAKLYKSALGNCFEEEEWGPIEWCIMAKHFERQGNSPYAYHAEIVSLHFRAFIFLERSVYKKKGRIAQLSNPDCIIMGNKAKPQVTKIHRTVSPGEKHW
ncbi:unnamed protein product [Ilex paraguariensis]|uniref:Uncharacterized protein n=1 Tax=Ilex paraguariensis TaxID=185542 RepID=A0ABC8SCC3_9AQUA